MKSICPNTFQTMINETIQLVDVRERYEFELYKMNLPIVENIPFSEIEELWSHFDADSCSSHSSRKSELLRNRFEQMAYDRHLLESGRLFKSISLANDTQIFQQHNQNL